MNKLQLQTKRQNLLCQLQSLDPWIEGSLVSTSRKCGKKNCACHHNGPRHPVLFVTGKEAGKGWGQACNIENYRITRGYGSEAVRNESGAHPLWTGLNAIFL